MKLHGMKRREVRSGDRTLLLVEPYQAAADAPVVLFVSGLGGAWYDWLPVARVLGDQVRILICDRPGTGDAPPNEEGTTDLPQAARDLQAVLDEAGVGRAVLVGHSMGGWYVESFARHYPERVAGLVLVDASLARVPEHGQPPALIPRPWRYALAALISRLLVPLVAHVPPVGPALRMTFEGFRGRAAVGPEHRERARATYTRPALWPAIMRELAAFPYLRTQLAVVRAEHRLPNVSVASVVAISAPTAISVWLRLHAGQAKQLSQREGVAVEVLPARHAPHLVMLTHPQRVASAVASSVRNRKR